ncbi:hypothetical protein Efla_006938 [Eimeria flavescens]
MGASFEFYTEEAQAGHARETMLTRAPPDLVTSRCPAQRALKYKQTGRPAKRVSPLSFLCARAKQKASAVLGGYSGMCPLVANFGNSSDDAKRTVEGSFWCVAPAYYTATGHCDSRWSFKVELSALCVAIFVPHQLCLWSQYFTMNMKRAFEKACLAKFPCEDTCEKQYTAPCPKESVMQVGHAKVTSSYIAASALTCKRALFL